jgi:hypothetical protein
VGALCYAKKALLFINNYCKIEYLLTLLMTHRTSSESDTAYNPEGILDDVTVNGVPASKLDEETIVRTAEGLKIAAQARGVREKIRGMLAERKFVVMTDESESRVMHVNHELLNAIQELRRNGLDCGSYDNALFDALQIAVKLHLKHGTRIKFTNGDGSHDIFIEGTPRLEKDFTLILDGIPTTFADDNTPRADKKESGSQPTIIKLPETPIRIMNNFKYE